VPPVRCGDKRPARWSTSGRFAPRTSRRPQAPPTGEAETPRDARRSRHRPAAWSTTKERTATGRDATRCVANRVRLSYLVAKKRGTKNFRSSGPNRHRLLLSITSVPCRRAPVKRRP